MVDLTTHYLGLELANPLVPSASPLSKDLDMAKRLEDAGAAALVMYSLFEEKVEHEQQHMARFLHDQAIGHAEADSFVQVPGDYTSYEDKYLDRLQALKQHLDIPIVASLNGISLDGWLDYGKALQAAGADALELNAYYVAADPNEDSQAIEHRYVALLTALREKVDIPITVKLSPYFSAMIDMARKLETAGANGLGLFNRFYQPDINLETLQVVPRLELSSSHETLLRIRWAALLFGKVNGSLAVTGGFHSVEDIVKALLAGANIVHLCSVLLQQGPGVITELLEGLTDWLAAREYDSVRQLIGSVSQQHALDAAAYERADYIHVLDSYTPASGVMK